MVPRIWNQTNPLFDQWAPCWWLSASTQLWPVSDLLSLSFLHFLSPPQKLKELSRGYLEVVKTFIDRHSPRLKVNRLRSLHGPEHEHRTEGKRREITLISFLFLCWKSFVFDSLPQRDGHAVTTWRRFGWKTTDVQCWRPLAAHNELMKNLWEA